jgi:hypothetical protein
MRQGTLLSPSICRVTNNASIAARHVPHQHYLEHALYLSQCRLLTVVLLLMLAEHRLSLSAFMIGAYPYSIGYAEASPARHRRMHNNPC